MIVIPNAVPSPGCGKVEGNHQVSFENGDLIPERVKTSILCGEIPERLADFAVDSEMEAGGRRS